jgi:hypothetical protein
MRLPLPHSRNLEETEGPLSAVDYICAAADLLQQMFSELQSLAARNPVLARALSKHESDASAHLWTLHETIRLLLDVDDYSTALPLSRRATALISWLSDEIDELTLCATGDNHPIGGFRVDRPDYLRP